MSIKSILSSVKGAYRNVKWGAKKHSPELFLATGIVTAVAATVTAVFAGKKIAKVVDKYHDEVKEIEAKPTVEKSSNPEETAYTEEVKKKELKSAKVNAGVKIGKALIVPTLLLGGSITAQILDHKTLSGRLAATAAAYSAFKNHIENGTTKDEVLEGTGEFDADGNEIMKAKTVTIVDKDDPYTMVFSKYLPDGTLNPNWTDDPEALIDWLRMEQSYLNKELSLMKGAPMFLNYVRNRLGGKHAEVQSGQVLGWTYDPDNPDHKGDNAINFGIDDIIKRYYNGEEIPGDRDIVLNFNVDGNVLYGLR